MAHALRDWLPNIIQSIDIWMSESDIDIGSRWGPDLDKELEKSQFGILCLTSECVTSTWIHYEAGALSKFVDKSRVCPYLLDLQPTDIKGPLVSFQAARADKDDTLKLVQTINRATGERVLPESRISTIFERFWPDLQKALVDIPSDANIVTGFSRPPEDMIEEILKTVREQSRIIAEIQTQLANLEVLRPIDPVVSKKIERSTAPSHIIDITDFISQDRGVSKRVIVRMSDGKDYKIEFNCNGQELQDQIINEVLDRLTSATYLDISVEKVSEILQNSAKTRGFCGEIKVGKVTCLPKK